MHTVQFAWEAHEERFKNTNRKGFDGGISYNSSNSNQNQSFGFLQRNIRMLDDAGLRNLLRFFTEADVIRVNKVEIRLTPALNLKSSIK